jgi:4-hydroxy-tetrahydrodipicolinate synthase
MNLQGSIVAIVTPFRDGKIDVAAYRKLIEFQLDNGTAGIVPCGTTGESATLSHVEHEDLIRLTVEFMNGRALVIAGAGSNNTAEALNLTRSAKEAGADAALLITPYYNKPSQQGLKDHFIAVADLGMPVVLYNCPGRTGVSLAPDTVGRLAEHQNIIAVKDATCSMDWTSEVCMIDGFQVISGDDSATLPQISVGAVGVISVLANVVPRVVSDLVGKALAGDYKGAVAIHRKYLKLMNTLFIESNPMPVKAACVMMNLIGPEIRPPLCDVQPESRDQLKLVMKDIGLI